MKEDKSGWVYILTNPSMPNILKIGKTSKHPLERVAELSAPTGIPTPFQLAYYQPCRDINFVEKEMHARFDSKRVRDNREFFLVSLFKAASTLDGIVGTFSNFEPRTPYAELFNTFEEREDGKLNAMEIEECRILKESLKKT